MRLQRLYINASRILTTVALAIAASGVVAPVLAADLPTFKDPIPDNLTFGWFTLYGVVDVNYTYQTKGMPFNSAYNTGVTYGMFGNPGSHRPISTIAEDGLGQTFVGVKLDKEIAPGISVVGKAEVGFNPVTGQLSDTCKSSAENNGVPLADQTAHGDGPRCGQLFNGQLFIGLDNKTYGTFTVGRQNTLDLDVIYNHDPFGLSYAFSAIGNIGSAGPGFGTAQGSRWDNAVKYTNTFGNVHFGAMYGQGGNDRGLQNGGYGFNLGYGVKDWAVDAVYTKQNGAIIATALPVNVPNALAAQVSDNSSYSIMGHYTFSLGNVANTAPDRLTFYAGYQNTLLSDPKDPLSNAVNGSTFNGYVLLAGYINSHPFATNKTLQTEWVGAKYELPSGWSFVGAYYHVSQNSFVARNAAGVVTGIDSCSTPSPTSNCAGDYHQASFMVDYAFTKHFDVYSGVNWSKLENGFAVGYLADSSVNFVTGARLKF